MTVAFLQCFRVNMVSFFRSLEPIFWVWNGPRMHQMQCRMSNFFRGGACLQTPLTRFAPPPLAPATRISYISKSCTFFIVGGWQVCFCREVLTWFSSYFKLPFIIPSTLGWGTWSAACY